MSRPLAALAACLCLSLPSPHLHAAEPLVIDGRDAQALQCSAMLYMAASVMHDAGFVPAWVRDDAQASDMRILEQLPGTQEQRIQAMAQRFEKIVDNQTPAELLDDYQNSERWCRREFLPEDVE